MAKTGAALLNSEEPRVHKVTKVGALLRALFGLGAMVAISYFVRHEVPDDPTRWQKFDGWTLGERLIFSTPFVAVSLHIVVTAVLSWFWPIYVRTSNSWVEVRDLFWRLKRYQLSSVDQSSSNFDDRWGVRLSLGYRYGKQVRITKFAGSGIDAIREDIRSRLSKREMTPAPEAMPASST